MAQSSTDRQLWTHSWGLSSCGSSYAARDVGVVARKNGAALEAVGKALGHPSTGVTSAHYVTAEAEAVARQLEVEVVLRKANHVRNAVD